MKILVICQFYYPERFTVSDICAELVELGHDVTVVTGKPNYCFNQILPEYRKVNYEVIQGVKVHRVNLYPRKMSRLSIYRNYLSYHRNAKAFVRRLKEDFDIVLSVSLSPVISIAPAILFAKKHHLKHVLHCLDLWPESTVATGAVKKDSLIYKILYKWSRKLYLGCDKILVSSPSFVEYFRDVLGIEDKPFAYVPQPSLTSTSTLPPVVYSKKHNFVYVGNIGHLQLIDELAQAGNLLRDCGDIEIHLAGMGSESAKLRAYIEENNLQGIVTYHGPLVLEKAETLYQNADAVIVTLKEGATVGKTIPNKLVHYLKYGKPIIGAISGDGRDILVTSGGAILAEQSADGIAKAMQEIIALSAEQKEAMGKKNRLFYEENFELRRVAQLLEKELLAVKNS
ncbi:MAG: glycosyltransferase family 4 protein [Bacilli bacterium]|jgi:glycosyltransferase involved in cell wall biosynthesis